MSNFQPTRYPQTQQNLTQQEPSESVIDQHSHFDGLYTTARDLRIEGTAEGEIMCEGTVNIAQSARATATIHAHTVILSGAANGDIYCRERFVLQPTGQMHGRVAAASLIIEEGAFFEGEFRMVMGGEEATFPTSANEPSLPALATPTPAATLLEEGDADEDEDEEDEDDTEPDDETLGTP